MIVTVPSLAERGSHERLQLIHSIFQDEEKRIHKSIHISSLVYRLLLSCECEGNIGELKNAIQASCVNALFASDQKAVFWKSVRSIFRRSCGKERIAGNRCPEKVSV